MCCRNPHNDYLNSYLDRYTWSFTGPYNIYNVLYFFHRPLLLSLIVDVSGL